LYEVRLKYFFGQQVLKIKQDSISGDTSKYCRSLGQIAFQKLQPVFERLSAIFVKYEH